MSKKIVFGCVFLCVLVFALACGSGSSKVAENNDTPANNNYSTNYTNANLVGTWKQTEKGEVTTYTFQNNGTFDESGTYQRSGTYSIQTGNTLVLISAGSSFTASFAVNGSDLALPALRVTNLGTDGQGPIGTYLINHTNSYQEYQPGSPQPITVTESKITTVQINVDHTFTLAESETKNGVQTNKTEEGTWSSSGATITITTSYTSDDPSITIVNPYVETFPFYHVNNDWVISGPICKKQ